MQQFTAATSVNAVSRRACRRGTAGTPCSALGRAQVLDPCGNADQRWMAWDGPHEELCVGVAGEIPLVPATATSVTTMTIADGRAEQKGVHRTVSTNGVAGARLRPIGSRQLGDDDPAHTVAAFWGELPVIGSHGDRSVGRARSHHWHGIDVGAIWSPMYRVGSISLAPVTVVVSIPLRPGWATIRTL